VRRRRVAWEVYSLSAIDLFASAMGAFVIIAIILMPDYQKEVRSQGDLQYLEELAGRTDAILKDSELGRNDILQALLAAQTRHEELQAEQQRISAEIQTINAEKQASADQPPPPPPEPEEPIPEPTGRHQVTFRFLGLKTDQTRILFLVDMNAFLGRHSKLVKDTVVRAMDSLGDGYEFGILGFQELDSGPNFIRWPPKGLAVMTSKTRSEANRFLEGMKDDFKGSSPLLAGITEALESPAGAIVLFSDGLPNPAFNDGLNGNRLVRRVIQLNHQHKEIHAVTIGDYYKYRGTVEFMERLAGNNSGDFLAVSD
jgi:hypothetical protein